MDNITMYNLNEFITQYHLTTEVSSKSERVTWELFRKLVDLTRDDPVAKWYCVVNASKLSGNIIDNSTMYSLDAFTTQYHLTTVCL